jgi:hypothetical protein
LAGKIKVTLFVEPKLRNVVFGKGVRKMPRDLYLSKYNNWGLNLTFASTYIIIGFK